ncbi:MAG: hypothetical protein JXQ75_04585 [Phycisphaerae bacterium]|nr:hypothetical protein [Phycisphaerae bacterium]
MNAKILRIVVVLVVALSVLAWIRSNGRHDFDIRSVIPFMHGSDVSLYDWAGLVVIALGAWSLARLGWGAGTRRQREPDTTGRQRWEIIDGNDTDDL